MTQILLLASATTLSERVTFIVMMGVLLAGLVGAP